MKRSRRPWDTLLVAAIVAMTGICAQTQQLAFAEDTAELEGEIVQIGPAKGDETVAPAVVDETEVDATPTYWIGLRGRGVDDPVLRTHLQLAEGTGIVVEDVVADSPAQKAGLQKHDIILRANDDMVDSMETLQTHVQTGKDKPIELEIIRLGKETTATVTPAERPADYQQLAGGADGVGVGPGGFGGDIGRMIQQQLQAGGMPGMRQIGPGMVLGGRNMNMNLDALNGISISVQREGEGPAQITVKKGDQTWNLSSDDAKALAELPEDVRNAVSGMMGGGLGGLQQQLFGNIDLEAELRHNLPKQLGMLPGLEDAQAKEKEMLERMNQMEQQLKELQEKLEAEQATN
jgi:membrane-associated protease RseP (regulator of RpoE activity)